MIQSVVSAPAAPLSAAFHQPASGPGNGSAIDLLRGKLASFTRTHLRAAGERRLFTRLAVIDQHLPWRGLPRHGLHELTGEIGAITSFLAALLGQDRKAREVLWIAPAQQQLYAPALARLGLAHDRLTLAHTRRAEDRLYAFEDALRDLGYGAVVAEIDQADLAETRRLHLAAEQGGSTGFLIRRDHKAPSAALTRWQIEAGDGLRPCWRISLLRCLNGQPANWLVEWDVMAGGFRLAA
ncbi:hypothetical protein [Ferrovibrio sp.]|uniref:ImuA family protein n=1 Tax=Ferrovibrio sp. TaxID=1917215 RepID=UPI001B4D9C53|nr:hypothetical protein [Ferrovibrio sp.]MBP7063240.1 hypothetical protein [Ferrovibrio sp.]